MKRALILSSMLLTAIACKSETPIHSTTPPPPLPPSGCTPEGIVTESDRPIAVCSASPEIVRPIIDSVDFLGSQSYDDNGGTISEYVWELIDAPDGSAAAFPTGVADRLGFTPDMAGEYTARLTVFNDRCIASEPCLATVTAVPNANLWVEMFWQFAGDDMDLHLTQGTSDYESDGDCYYGNCVGGGPDWGVGGSQDDASLDLDDIFETGPENINIEAPAAGSYRVVVHDYPGSEYWGANNVTVKITLGGNVVFNETRTITGEDTYTPFARIDWPSMTVTAL